jgi:hypothetical protein
MINENLSYLKDIHLGESIVYYGTGDTLKSYDIKSGLFKVGAGTIVHWEKELMDYLFITDTSASQDCMNSYNHKPAVFDNYKQKKDRFYRRKTPEISGMKPDKDAVYFSVTDRVNNNRNPKFHRDITEGLGFGYTTSCEVMQFLVYMGFKNIYLVGHDCDYSKPSIVGDKPSMKSDVLVGVWHKINEWIKKEAEEVNIFSINPIKLNIFPEVEYGAIA